MYCILDKQGGVDAYVMIKAGKVVGFANSAMGTDKRVNRLREYVLDFLNKNM